MTRSIELPIEEILSRSEEGAESATRTIGRSREGREVRACGLGRGALRVSLIGGCHADEPVGPAMLRKLVVFLDELDSRHPLRSLVQWRIAPHVNPDGEARNAPWQRTLVETTDHRGTSDLAFDLASYLRHVVRELPGDDIEFGFPIDEDDTEARPENRAVADFLAQGGPYDLHGSFHGMSLAPGPWFLLEPAWIDRTAALREGLREQVARMGYSLFDVDRKGEKGFRRIDLGFSTRPDSRAMRVFFEERNDPSTAAKFRPSSMEFARRLGSDPLTIVSEMPLFLASSLSGAISGLDQLQRLRRELNLLLASSQPPDFERQIQALGLRPMPIRDQMRLQLAFLGEALNTVGAP
jgi:hypothetical protein